MPAKWTPNDARAKLRDLRPGAVVAVGGLTIYRRPAALMKSLFESGAKDLVLAGLTLSIESELLVSRGRVKKVRTSYYGLEIFGLAPAFSKAAEAGALEVVDESERSFCRAIPSMGVEVALIHLPFVDAAGNGYGVGTPGVDVEIARAARFAIASFEEQRTPDPEAALWRIDAADLDAVVRVPGGARPTSCAPLYAFDGGAILAHAEAGWK